MLLAEATQHSDKNRACWCPFCVMPSPHFSPNSSLSSISPMIPICAEPLSTLRTRGQLPLLD